MKAPLAALAAALVAGCAAPPFRAQHPYPFGLAAQIEAGLYASTGDPARDAARRAAAAAALEQNCPDWDRVRIAHPIDPLFEPATPADHPLMGCHTAAALDAMLDRPADIADPPRDAGPASAQFQTRIVERHRAEGPPPLPERDAGFGTAP